MTDKELDSITLTEIFNQQIALLPKFIKMKEGSAEWKKLIAEYDRLFRDELILKEKLKLKEK